MSTLQQEKDPNCVRMCCFYFFAVDKVTTDEELEGMLNCDRLAIFISGVSKCLVVETQRSSSFGERFYFMLPKLCSPFFNFTYFCLRSNVILKYQLKL